MFYFEKPSIKDVFQYRRKSLEDDDPRQTHSLPMQDTYNQELADRLNLRIVDTFEDCASAKMPNNRPEFTRMLKELSYRNSEKRRAEGILAWHPDRLSRNGKESGMIVQMLCDDLIKDLFFPVYHFHNDPSGIEHLMMEFGRAISYSGWLSINSKRGSHGREEKGAWVYGRSKFGYTKLREVPETPKLCSLFPIPDEKTFPARKRLVELWKAGVTDEICAQTIKREFGLSLGRPAISNMRKDPFNYGIYVIKEGEEDERRIDFRTLTAPDGTAFEAVADEPTYWNFQSFKRKEAPLIKKSKHTNPLKGKIACSQCQSGMRPARRNIHRKGAEVIKELGYECQTIYSNQSRCPQSRIRFQVLSERFESAIQKQFGVLGEKTYAQYLAGLKHFLTKKTQSEKQSRTRISKRISALETEKSTVIDKKLAAIKAYHYDDETRKWVTRRLKEINRDLKSFKENHQSEMADAEVECPEF